jgi:hypothetical protein
MRCQIDSRLRFSRACIPRACAAVAVAVAAIVGSLAFVRGTHSALVGASPCVRIGGSVARYCGPATARLSVFPGFVFRNGSCVRKKLDGVRLLQLRIGARSLDGSRTNDGLPLFSLGMTGSPSRPRAGSVVAYYRGKRWFGRGVSFKGDALGGTFVAQGVAGNRGPATGSFRC